MHSMPVRNPKLAVVALGGNAIIRNGERGDFAQQFSNTSRSMRAIVELIKIGYDVVVTHGNGPQVGSLMLMVEHARGHVPETPLCVANAMTAGSMGYMIEQCLRTMLLQADIHKNVVTVPAQVLVDKDDPAMDHPSKPIGPFYEEHEARALAREKGWIVRDDAHRGWRRHVASPYPVDIIEKDAVRLLLDQDFVVITCGGGGVPVRFESDGTLTGVDGVIDKDLASMRLALSIGAAKLIIITAVPRVSLGFGAPEQRDLTRMTLAQARRFQEEQQFPSGSMGPKIQAAIEFVQADDRNQAIITDVDGLIPALEGREGTTVVANE
jgi:carbamate kinase